MNLYFSSYVPVTANPNLASRYSSQVLCIATRPIVASDINPSRNKKVKTDQRLRFRPGGSYTQYYVQFVAVLC